MVLHLLAIEDDAAIADVIVEVAVQMDMKARSIINTERVEKICESVQPDIVVLDILMPGRDGFEVLGYLAEHHPNVHIIVLSGEDHYRKMAEKIALGKGQRVAAVMRKPFRVAELRNVLCEISGEIADASNSRHSA